ncbi:ferritin-like domain-containing protein [Mycena albidolilacea]|uniref:Ferritin-like domain-containing protein n=1 Tax=Mycena albidolilacea TaxID=1033008 RepID=A0AAD7ATK8_9AGAR|nr:ferritin-like domain-containing protein [Mycena albidolilacea]
MKTTIITLTLALGATAVPHVQRDDSANTIDDTTVLNFALTLEHLENTFYSEALKKFSQADFEDAGLPSHAYGRFSQVAQHEAAHVAFLSNVLGSNATQPCNYSFPYTDPVSFAALSQVIEGVGTSAYTGAAQYITSKSYLTAAASVLATEARHASWVASAVNKFAGWSGALNVPLGLNEVYTIAAAFITSCPSTNPALPVKAFPTLTVTTTPYSPGKSISLKYTPATPVADGTPLYVAFYTGLSVEYAKLENNAVVVPKDLRGQVYAVVTTSGSAVDGTNTIAGPAILLFEFDSAGMLIM